VTASGLWIPGELVPTNRALSDMRAAGWFEGYAQAMIRTGKWRNARPGEDRYAEEAAATRRRAAFQARAAGLAHLGAGDRVRLRFSVQGHPRWDASGAMLAAKWCEDGLVEAGVIPSDRHNVAEVAVTVVQTSTVLDAPRGVYVEMERAR
jgi:hypothetical protein